MLEISFVSKFLLKKSLLTCVKFLMLLVTKIPLTICKIHSLQKSLLLVAKFTHYKNHSHLLPNSLVTLCKNCSLVIIKFARYLLQKLRFEKIVPTCCNNHLLLVRKIDHYLVKFPRYLLQKSLVSR